MIRIFKAYGSAGVVLILIWAMLMCYVSLFMRLSIVEYQLDTINIQWREFNWQAWLSSVAIMTFIAALINEIYQKYELVKTRNSYPGAFYILLCALIPAGTAVNTYSYSALVLTIALYFLFKMYRKVLKGALVFNIAICMGIMIFLNLSTWPLAIFFMVAITLINFFKINEFILYSLSLFIPLFLYWAYLSYYSVELSLSDVVGTMNFGIDIASLSNDAPIAILLGVLILIYYFGYNAIVRPMRIGAKKFISIIHYLLFSLIVLHLIILGSSYHILVLAGIPLSLMLGLRSSSNTKNYSLALILFYLMIISLVLFYFYF